MYFDNFIFGLCAAAFNNDHSEPGKTGFSVGEEINWRIMDTEGKIYKADPIYLEKEFYTTNNKFNYMALSLVTAWENVEAVTRYYCDHDGDGYISSIFQESVLARKLVRFHKVVS